MPGHPATGQTSTRSGTMVLLKRIHSCSTPSFWLCCSNADRSCYNALAATAVAKHRHKLKCRAQQLGQPADPRLETLRLPAIIDGRGNNRDTILARAPRLRQLSEHKTGMVMHLDVTIGTSGMATYTINVARGVANGSLGTVVGYAWARGDERNRLTTIPEDCTRVHALRNTARSSSRGAGPA